MTPKDEMKTCNRYREGKPLSAYGPDRKGKGGLRGICRGCTTQATRDWRAANPDKSKASEAAWRAKNTEKVQQLRVAGSRARRDESQEHAVRKGQEWSDEDRVTLLREDISLMEISRLVGRTYGATAVARQRAKELRASQPPLTEPTS